MKKRSSADLSHRLLTSLDFGRLTPILCEDVLPGDTFRISSEVYIKAIPLLAPIMDQCDVRCDYFFVPNRLLWEDWPTFITGGVQPNGTLLSPKMPRMRFNPNSGEALDSSIIYLDPWIMNHLYQFSLNNEQGSIGEGGFDISALPAMAYQKIFYDWYAVQNVDSEFVTVDGKQISKTMILHDDLTANGYVKRANTGSKFLDINLPKYRSFRRDYFTNANPWPQAGPEVSMQFPPSDMDGLSSTPDSSFTMVTGSNGSFSTPEAQSAPPQGNASFGTGELAGELVDADGNWTSHTHGLSTVELPDYITDGISAGAFGSLSIPELRRLNALQKWFERNARWGSRYIEQIMSHFGVRTPDYRLQRSEYLGGTVQPINVSETYQTSTPANATQEQVDVLGQYAGHLSSYGINGMRKYRAQEHGWIIGILSVVPKTSYGQGLHKRFTRFDRLDFAFPEFAGIGEQAIFNRELYVGEHDGQFDQSASNTWNKIFGYVPRYYEYFKRTDRFDQAFLNDFPFWHLGRVFDSAPVLNKGFYSPAGSNFDRIFAYSEANTETGHLLVQVNHHIKARRSIPKTNPHL